MESGAHSTVENKIKAIEGLPATFAADPMSAFAGLFFAARNGAIAHLLRELEHHFQDQGFQVRAEWKESSLPGVTIALVLHDKRTGPHVRRLQIDRQTTRANLDLGSSLVYALKSVHAGEYYGGRKPKVAVDFDAILETAAFREQAEKWVLGTNYPFAYANHSSF